VENGIIVEGVQPIRHYVFTHYSNHFKARRTVRPGVENLSFKTLSVVESGGLIRPFSIEEVKAVIGIVIVSRAPVQIVSTLGS